MSMSTIKVRVTRAFYRDRKVVAAGSVVDLPAAVALEVVAMNKAELVPAGKEIRKVVAAGSVVDLPAAVALEVVAMNKAELVPAGKEMTEVAPVKPPATKGKDK